MVGVYWGRGRWKRRGMLAHAPTCFDARRGISAGLFAEQAFQLVRGTAGRTAGCTRTILEHGAELLLQVAGGDLRGLGTDRADDFLRHLGRRGTALVLADILPLVGGLGRRQAAASQGGGAGRSAERRVGT